MSLALALLALENAISDDSIEPYHLEVLSTTKVRITASITRKSTEEVQAWDVITASPPDLAGQRVTLRQLFLDGHQVRNSEFEDEDGRGIRLLGATVTAEQVQHRDPMSAKVVFEAALTRSQLVPGAPKTLVQPLRSTERRLNLQATDHIDFKTRTFQQYLDVAGLRRGAKERVIDFCRRAYRHVRKSFSYTTDLPVPFGDSSCSSDITTLRGHCGNYTRVVVGIMRANQIPARVQFGHCCIEGTYGIGLPHTRAEFWVDGIGWVLSDPSTGLTPGPWKQESDVDCGFGGDGFDFITFNIHPAVRFRTAHFGVQKQDHLQNLWLAAVGGTWEGATYVTEYKFEILK